MRSCSLTCASSVALAGVCAVFLAALLRPRPAGAEEKLTVRTGPISVLLSEGDRPVLEYRYAEVPFKPYVKQFFTPGGVQVLRDSPEDHKHHRALMFAIAADDVTFWDESPKAGKEVHKSFSGTKVGERDGLSTAELTEALEWIAPGEKEPLLKEERKVEAIKGAAPGASLLTWTSRLEAAPGRKSVKLGGSHYYGLGARFLVSMDTGGSFFNEGGKTGEVVRGDERLTPSRWCAYTAVADGKPVTFAMFDDPKNARPALWFTMAAPFGYLSATINLWKEPYVLEAGKPLALTYGAAVWDGKVGAEQVEALYRRWLELEGAAAPKGAPR